MNLSDRSKRLAERINSLSLRERALLAVGVFAVVFLLCDLFLMKPTRDRQARVQTELEQVRDRVGQMSSMIQQIATEGASDPNIELRARVEALELETGALENRLGSSFGDIAEPRQALDVLTGLLADRNNLTVIVLENAAPEALSGNAGELIAGIFVHRVRLVVESDHAGVRDYLGLVSNLPDGVYLESMDLSVPDWPINRVELVLFSLTLDSDWLGV